MVIQRNVCKAEEILDRKKERNQCNKRKKTKTIKIKSRHKQNSGIYNVRFSPSPVPKTSTKLKWYTRRNYFKS